MEKKKTAGERRWLQPSTPRKTLQELDAVLSNLPESQYDHSQTSPPMAAAIDKAAPPAPKRRGRKPKSAAPAAEPAKEAAGPAQDSPKRRGRPPQNAAPAVPNGADAPKKRRGRPPKVAAPGEKLKIIPLGGLGEIGKNLTVYEYGGDILLVDCGLGFPDEEMLGVDLVIPDFSYLEENRAKIRGLLVTHGHEDHIGAIPYLLKALPMPVYATRLTIGLIEGKLREHGILEQSELHIQRPGDRVRLGAMEAAFIAVNHSIPDSCAFAIHTPVGVVIQTGDFKIDYTPINGEVADLARFGELGSQGVLALLSDSTNAEHPGSTPSELTVGDSFDAMFQKAGDRRILIATFSSNVHRVQQVIHSAVKYGRKVAVVGRSMENITAKALEMGYLSAPEGTVLSIDAISRLPDREAVILTTGSQGEPMSALTRMAMGEHRRISIGRNDFIILSANPIPGNEKLVGRVVNELLRLGAEVIYERFYEVHVSGHACQDEEKLMLALTRPRFFVPVHGEYKHLKKHAALAMRMGMAEENVILPELGRVMEFTANSCTAASSVTAGAVLVDGLGVGDVGSVVLRDRKRLGEDGLIVVAVTLDNRTGKILAGPDIVSRGFVYVREAEEMMNETRRIVRQVLQESSQNGTRDWSNLKLRIRDAVSTYLFGLTKRSPMILPILEEVRLDDTER